MPRNRNGGIRKRCGCPRRNWAKCSHGWHFNYKPKGGQHYRLSLDREVGQHIDNKHDADLAAARLRIAIDGGTFRPTIDAVDLGAGGQQDVETLRSYAGAWLTVAVHNLKASTVRYYRDNLENHILPALGDRAINSITRRDCRDLVTSARGKGLKIETVRGIVRTLSTVLSQAVEDDYLPANPALAMRKYLRRGDEPAPTVDPLTRDESSRLLEIARTDFPQWHPWLLCALRTGMRAGELLGLQWGDVDWSGRYLQLERSIVRGKVTTPKNHQARRVDLSPQLRAVLRLWRRRLTREWLGQGLPRPDWVFPSALGTALDESNMRKVFNRMLDRAGLHRRGPHQMRHTFASLLLQTGEPITYVSRQLGHRDSAITLRVYAHYLPDVGARKGVDRLDDGSTVAQPLHKRSPYALPRTA